MLITFRQFNRLMEGVDDPGILKCVFMAGGPGSGKSYAAEQLFNIDTKIRSSFSTHGLKLVNSDIAFERILQQHGVNPKDLAQLYHDKERWSSIMDLRKTAKSVTLAQRTGYESGRLGMIIDGTGDDAADMAHKVSRARGMGYDCYMVFINTSLETALERNARRARSLPDTLVHEIWQNCQKNLGAFQHLFGIHAFLIVDNDDQSTAIREMDKQIRAWMREPVRNPIGRAWITAAGGRHH